MKGTEFISGELFGTCTGSKFKWDCYGGIGNFTWEADGRNGLNRFCQKCRTCFF